MITREPKKFFVVYKFLKKPRDFSTPEVVKVMDHRSKILKSEGLAKYSDYWARAFS